MNLFFSSATESSHSSSSGSSQGFSHSACQLKESAILESSNPQSSMPYIFNGNNNNVSGKRRDQRPTFPITFCLINFKAAKASKEYIIGI